MLFCVTLYKSKYSFIVNVRFIFWFLGHINLKSTFWFQGIEEENIIRESHTVGCLRQNGATLSVNLWYDLVLSARGSSCQQLSIIPEIHNSGTVLFRRKHFLHRWPLMMMDGWMDGWIWLYGDDEDSGDGDGDDDTLKVRWLHPALIPKCFGFCEIWKLFWSCLGNVWELFSLLEGPIMDVFFSAIRFKLFQHTLSPYGSHAATLNSGRAFRRKQF